MNQSKDVRNIQKKFKINKAEEILLTQRINKSGLTASEYIRQSVLHDNPVAVIDKANIIIPQLADISSLTNDLLDCDTLPPDQRDIVNLIQKGVLELWQSLSKENQESIRMQKTIWLQKLHTFFVLKPSCPTTGVAMDS